MPNLSARLGVCVISACKSYKALLEFRGPCEVSSEWVDWMACESRSIFKSTPSCPHNCLSLGFPTWIYIFDATFLGHCYHYI